MYPCRQLLPFIAVLLTGCASPTEPTPAQKPPTVPAAVTNAPPTITRFTVQGGGIGEPPNFANASETVPIFVEVADAESPIANLRFNWSADLGTVTGTGSRVTWTAPALVQAPTEVTITLEVVETYSSQGVSRENRVIGTTPISLHDSAREVTEMARGFLMDFADSSRDVSYVMRTFQPGCYGTDAETADVTDNRLDFRITESRVENPLTTVAFGRACPVPGKNPQQADACARVRTYSKASAIRASGSRNVGDEKEVEGVSHLAALYFREQGRWRLCDHQFEPDDLNALKSASSLRRTLP